MKYIIFLILLVPFLTFAKYYEGDLKFSDGKSLHGFFEIPSISDKKINFKSNNDSKSEKFLTNDLDELNFNADNNEKVVMYAKYFYSAAISKKQVDHSDNKIWLLISYEGKLKIYYNYVTSSGTMGYGKIPTQKTDVQYFVKTENRDFPQTFFKVFGGMVLGQFSYIKKVVQVTFEDICPDLFILIVKNDINEKGVYTIGELYDKNCAK
jgi:hypothetical protein